MCEHCEKYEPIYADQESGMFYNVECLVSREYIVDESYPYYLVMTDGYSGGYHEWRKRINYCPMCGRKLFD